MFESKVNINQQSSLWINDLFMTVTKKVPCTVVIT